MLIASIDEIQALIGQELGPSPWTVIDQGRIDRFADTTNDHQYIHVDAERAALSSFGGTIAHGLLTLALLPGFGNAVIPKPAGMKMSANYGYNRIRFISPVHSGKRVRGRFTLISFTETKAGRWQQIAHAVVEIENQDKPALMAECISQIQV
jgi:acyl dehydratase